MITIYLTSMVRSWIFTQMRVTTAIWEKLAMFYGYYGALYETKELKERYETLVKSSEAET